MKMCAQKKSIKIQQRKKKKKKKQENPKSSRSEQKKKQNLFTLIRPMKIDRCHTFYLMQLA